MTIRRFSRLIERSSIIEAGHFHALAARYAHKQNGRRKRRQLNVLGARFVETRVKRPKFVKYSLLGGALFAFGVALGRTGQNLFGDQAGVLPDRGFDLGGHVGIGLEERL